MLFDRSHTQRIPHIATNMKGLCCSCTWQLLPYENELYHIYLRCIKRWPKCLKYNRRLHFIAALLQKHHNKKFRTWIQSPLLISRFDVFGQFKSSVFSMMYYSTHNKCFVSSKWKPYFPIEAHALRTSKSSRAFIWGSSKIIRSLPDYRFTLLGRFVK